MVYNLVPYHVSHDCNFSWSHNILRNCPCALGGNQVIQVSYYDGQYTYGETRTQCCVSMAMASRKCRRKLVMSACSHVLSSRTPERLNHERPVKVPDECFASVCQLKNFFDREPMHRVAFARGLWHTLEPFVLMNYAGPDSSLFY